MSFNNLFISLIYAFSVDSNNKITCDILEKLKKQCHEIDKPDAFDNLLVLIEHVLSLGVSGEISVDDQSELTNLISLAINQTVMINKRIEWYRTQLPEVNISSFDALHELVALHDIIIADGILNEDTEYLLLQINSAINCIKKIFNAISTVV
jgi:hypothetical protein